jgi:hypothetical protein
MQKLTTPDRILHRLQDLLRVVNGYGRLARLVGADIAREHADVAGSPVGTSLQPWRARRQRHVRRKEALRRRAGWCRGIPGSRDVSGRIGRGSGHDVHDDGGDIWRVLNRPPMGENRVPSEAMSCCCLYRRNRRRWEIVLSSDRTRSRFTRSVTSLLVSVLTTRSFKLRMRVRTSRMQNRPVLT